MPTSDARFIANRQNCLKSCGPKSPETKAISARNSYKHGLAGRGVVLSEEDAAEVERRREVLAREMGPKSELGSILVLRIATTSVRMERAARQEFAAVAEQVRNAPDQFDESRADRAEALFDAIHEDLRGHLRKLKKTPEGLTLLVDAWRELRSDITRPAKPFWTAAHLVKAANLLGIREEDALGSRLGVLSNAAWGDFSGLGDHEGGHLEEDARKAWARAKVVERIDQAFVELEQLAETLDLETIELDRAESGERALFDPSKAASLARRYEAEATRGFYKALDQFRQAEAEAAAVVAVAPSASALASSREGDPEPEPAPLEMAPEHLRPVSREVLEQVPVVLGPDSQPMRYRSAAPEPS